MLEDEDGGSEVAEAGVEVEKLGGEEEVSGSAGDDEKGVEGAGKAEGGAGEKEAVEIHGLREEEAKLRIRMVEVLRAGSREGRADAGGADAIEASTSRVARNSSTLHTWQLLIILKHLYIYI